jgi:hypothetical protein
MQVKQLRNENWFYTTRVLTLVTSNNAFCLYTLRDRPASLVKFTQMKITCKFPLCHMTTNIIFGRII